MGDTDEHHLCDSFDKRAPMRTPANRSVSAMFCEDMRTSLANIASREQLPDRQIIVSLSGCVLALLFGALATTHYGVLLGSAVVGLAFFGVAIVTYRRDPILALLGLWFFELINSPLSAIFGYFSSTGKAIRQGDEVLVLLFVILTGWHALRSTGRPPSLRFVLPGVGVAVCGFLGAIVFDVPLNVFAVGGLLDLKLWIMVVVSLALPWKPRDIGRVYSTLVVAGVVVAALGFADYLTHGAVSRALHTSNYNPSEGEYRSNSVHSIFPQPGEFSLFMSLLFAVTFARFGSSYRKSDLVLALIFAGSALLSLRLKGFLSIAVVVAVVGLAQAMSRSRRATAALLIGLVLLGGAYVLEGSVISKQISTYTSSESSARSRLYSTGEKIGLQDFPLGVGFGRFASYPSLLYYSPVYYQYHLSRVFGLSKRFPDFIDDTSWPTVIGETGYGGFLAYMVGLIVLIAAGVQQLRRSALATRWIPLAMICTLAVILADSLGEASLFSWLATATFAMIVGPALIGARMRMRQPARPLSTSPD